MKNLKCQGCDGNEIEIIVEPNGDAARYFFPIESGESIEFSFRVSATT